MIVCLARNANTARFGYSLKTCGDIHAITKDIVVVDNDVAEVYSDSKFDPLIDIHLHVPLAHGVDLRPINAGDPTEMERGIAAFARSPNGGLIVTVGGTAVRRDVIVDAAAKNGLPAIYPYRYFASDGGLVSYGPDTVEPYVRAASYVDRVLKGEKPANLPVQAPTKYRLVINLKTARALGLNVPPSLLARADELIE